MVTALGVPEKVPAPTVSALGPRALRLSWTAPSRPNGAIREYRIEQIGAGIVFTAGGRAWGHDITGTCGREVMSHGRVTPRLPVACHQWLHYFLFFFPHFDFSICSILLCRGKTTMSAYFIKIKLWPTSALIGSCFISWQDLSSATLGFVEKPLSLTRRL